MAAVSTEASASSLEVTALAAISLDPTASAAIFAAVIASLAAELN
jgi:hypothetical protein